jgi:hypothetical protein
VSDMHRVASGRDSQFPVDPRLRGPSPGGSRGYPAVISLNLP